MLALNHKQTLCLAKWGHAGCYSRWTSSLFCFGRESGSETGGKMWHVPVLNKKGELLSPKWAVEACTLFWSERTGELVNLNGYEALLSCQIKLLKQKGRPTFHKLKNEWVFGGLCECRKSLLWYLVGSLVHNVLLPRRHLHKLQPCKTCLLQTCIMLVLVQPHAVDLSVSLLEDNACKLPPCSPCLRSVTRLQQQGWTSCLLLGSKPECW